MDVLDHRSSTLYPDLGVLMGTGMVERVDHMGVVGLDRIELGGHGVSLKKRHLTLAYLMAILL
jgi:hypothetical protein